MTHADQTAFHSRANIFRREFNVAELQAFCRPFCEETTVPVAFDSVWERCPYYQQLLIDDHDRERFAAAYLPQLLPFCQSPFPLPGRQVVQGPWQEFWKLDHFAAAEVNAGTVEGKRILDVGCNAGFDTLFLSTLGAAEVIGIEPSPFYFQALFLWALYDCPNVRLVRRPWQEVSIAAFGSFDIINCQGILYHERNPMLLLQSLFDLLAPRGKLVLETHITMESGPSALFVEGDFWGGSEWWWIPSIETVCAMLRATGFEDVKVLNSYEAPSKNPADPKHTVEGHPAGGRALVTAVRST